MYLRFYSLKKTPFHITPDPGFLYLSPSHKEALASMIYGVKKRKGFIAITGEVGVGKTTVLRSYLERVSQDEIIKIYIFNANLSFEALLRAIYRELGIETVPKEPSEMVDFLHEFLIEQYAQNKNVVLIIDEAQNMPLRTLENLRMLSNLETSQDKLLQIILVGQPEFDNMLNTQDLRQLKQRIAVSCRIQPLTQKESLAYIRYRLAKAALGNRQIFTPKAMKRIVKRSKGIPRLINIICDNALVTGYAYQQKSILPKIINEVIKDLQLTKPKPFLAWKLGLWCLSGLCAALLLLYSVGHMLQTPVPSHKIYKKMDSVIHRGDKPDAPLGAPDRTKEPQLDDLKKPEISRLSDLGRP